MLSSDIEKKIKEAFPELRNNQHLLRSLMTFLNEANKIADEISKTLTGGDCLIIEILRSQKEESLTQNNTDAKTI